MQLLRLMPLLLIPFVATPGRAQQTTPTQEKRVPGTPIRDSQALTVVQTALTALGGSGAIGQPQSWQIQGQLQATDPTGKNVSGTINWEMAGSEFLMSATTNVGTQSVMTGHGNAAAVSSTAVLKLPPFVARAKFVPALVGSMLLSEFQNTNYSIRYVEARALGTESVTVIKTTGPAAKGIDPRVTVQFWYFDKTSGLPVRLEYRIPALTTPLVSIMGAAVLSNYQAVSGAMYPFQIALYYKNTEAEAVTIQSVNLNVAIPPSDFDPPVAAQ